MRVLEQCREPLGSRPDECRLRARYPTPAGPRCAVHARKYVEVKS